MAEIVLAILRSLPYAQGVTLHSHITAASQAEGRRRFAFRRDLMILHIDLEEARLALEDGEIRAPKRKAEEALRGWAQVKYAKGMSDALRILGTLEYIQGKPEKALELYIVSCRFGLRRMRLCQAFACPEAGVFMI